MNKQNVPRSAGDNLKRKLGHSLQQLSMKNNKVIPVKRKSTVFGEQVNFNLPFLENRYEEQDLQIRKKSQCFEGMSTLEMLKKQAQLLQCDDCIGTVKRFSTLQSRSPIKDESCILQVTKFKKANCRKVARGRPQIYNLVRKYKKQIANMGSNSKQESKRNSSSQLSQVCQRGTFMERLKKLQDLKSKSKTNNLIHKKTDEQNHRMKTQL